MLLTGSEIKKEIERGNICIDPFDQKKVNSNSYNLALHNELITYNCNEYIDTREDNPTSNIVIPNDGYIFLPGKLYLAKTVEYTETYNLVPIISGRSSIGRLGIFIHITAGFGDIGYCGNWTLEISVVQPVKIYPWIEICQIYYETAIGEQIHYNGKYQNIKEIASSKIYKEFEGDTYHCQHQ